MRKNKDNQQAGITQDEMLAILERSGRPNFTKRQLTQLRSEGLLPKLRRTAHAGSNKPIYIWEQDVIEQAAYLYDLAEWGNGHHWLFLALWLRGYEVPFVRVPQCWIRSIDAYLQDLTRAEQDPDDALWQISTTITEHMEPKWKFSPRPDELIRDLGTDAWREFTEFFLDVLLVPTYEPDEISFSSVLTTLQRISRMAKANPQRSDDTLSQAPFADAEKALQWLQSLREVFHFLGYGTRSSTRLSRSGRKHATTILLSANCCKR